MSCAQVRGPARDERESISRKALQEPRGVGICVKEVNEGEGGVVQVRAETGTPDENNEWANGFTKNIKSTGVKKEGAEGGGGGKENYISPKGNGSGVLRLEKGVNTLILDGPFKIG